MTKKVDLIGKRVVVLGGGGIGGACVSSFMSSGARVAVIDKDPDSLRQLDRQDSSQALTCFTGDASSEEACQSLLNQAVSALGGCDIFVHALGVNLRKPVLDFTSAEWSRLMCLNLDTAFWSSKVVGRELDGGGRVVFVSSVAGTLGHKDHAPYAASKGAINQFMRGLAREWASRGIGVNAVAPGYIETDLTKSHLNAPGVREELVNQIPWGRLGTPAEVADVVLFLCSELAGFVTGQVLHVDGGRTLV